MLTAEIAEIAEKNMYRFSPHELGDLPEDIELVLRLGQKI